MLINVKILKMKFLDLRYVFHFRNDKDVNKKPNKKTEKVLNI